MLNHILTWLKWTLTGAGIGLFIATTSLYLLSLLGVPL